MLISAKQKQMSNEEVYTVFEMRLKRYQLKIDRTPKTLEKESLHASLCFVLGLSQCFGLLPCLGTCGDSCKMKFKVVSWKVIWSGILLCCHVFMATMATWNLVVRGIDFRTCNVVMIYTTGLIIHSLYFRLSAQWPKLMKDWSRMENLMSVYGYPKNLSRNIRILVGFLLLVVLSEYTFSLWHSIHHIYRQQNDSVDVLQGMYVLQFSFIHNYLEYSKTLAFFSLICNFICMYVWNINDLLIIVMSLALAARFAQIKDGIISITQQKVDHENSWRRLRDDYNNVMKLFMSLEASLSYNILISFTTNLYFILVQLFQTLHEEHSGVGNFYFFSSFGMLVMRTFAVSLFAAQINDNSKELLFHLSQVPSEIYTPEIEWLMLQIVNEPIALTGCKLFKITRGLVFTIAGTIVTYELFLFQFNISTGQNDSENNVTNLYL